VRPGLDDPPVPPPALDAESAREFLREALTAVAPGELDALAQACAAKHRRFATWLGTGRPPADAQSLERVLRHVFATRRRVREVTEAIPPGRLAEAIHLLLHGAGALPARFGAFVEALAPLPETLRTDLGSEVLHYTDPARYWLWTRWIWDPRTRTGALPLVVETGADLAGAGAAETYLRVGAAVGQVERSAEAAGLGRLPAGGFGADVFLAAVYAVYVHTVVRLAITREFTRALPPAPELCRRLLGVHRMDPEG
jgi:hypothetical protein